MKKLFGIKALFYRSYKFYKRYEIAKVHKVCKVYKLYKSGLFSALLGIAFFFSTVLSSTALFSAEKKEKEEVEKASKSLGFLIGKKIKNSPLKLDQNKIFEGLKEALSSKKPTLSEKECVASLVKMEEKIQTALSEQNLLQASLFLQKNAKDKGVVTLKKNRLQYQVLKEGQGETVTENSSPLIRSKGTLLNDEVFLSQEEQVVVLKELLPGLQKAIIGMKENEKRKIFIHPSMGYGQDQILPPNSLLIFEVEVLKADKSKISNHLPSKVLAEEKTIR